MLQGKRHRVVGILSQWVPDSRHQIYIELLYKNHHFQWYHTITSAISYHSCSCIRHLKLDHLSCIGQTPLDNITDDSHASNMRDMRSASKDQEMLISWYKEDDGRCPIVLYDACIHISLLVCMQKREQRIYEAEQAT